MATARKLPSGSWRCQIYDYTDDKGKRHYRSFTCTDPTPKGKRKCEAMAANYALTKESNNHDMDNQTFETAVKAYISSKRPVLSPSTIRGYTNILNALKQSNSWFCELNMYKIDSKTVQRLINDISTTKSPNKVRNYHGLISAVTGQSYHTTLPQKIKPDLYIPTDDEVKKLISYSSGTELEIPVLLAAFCMMRRGEICGASIDDLSNDNILHVRHSKVMGDDLKMHLKAPKTDSSDRYIQLPDFVADKIRSKGCICKILPDTITKELGKLLRKHGLQEFRFHDLRHYCASVWHSLNVPDAYIMSYGGWSSDKVLKEIYRHALSDRQKEMNNIPIQYFKGLYSEDATRNATQKEKSPEN